MPEIQLTFCAHVAVSAHTKCPRSKQCCSFKPMRDREKSKPDLVVNSGFRTWPDTYFFRIVSFRLVIHDLKTFCSVRELICNLSGSMTHACFWSGNAQKHPCSRSPLCDALALSCVHHDACWPAPFIQWEVDAPQPPCSCTSDWGRAWCCHSQ